MPRIVEPEDEDSFGIARASGPSGTSSSGQGFVPGKKVKTWKASPQIFPTQLTRETEQLLKKVEFAVQDMRVVRQKTGWQSRQKKQQQTTPSSKVAGGL